MEKETNTKLLYAVVLMSDYNWFKVTVSSAGNETAFYATSVNAFMKDYLVFERQFSTSEFSDKIIDISAITQYKFTFLTKSDTLYIVECYHNNTIADPDTSTGKKENPETLVDWTRSRIDENGGLLVVLDLRKLGRITPTQNFKIKRWMDTNLDGAQVKYRCCRTIYFKLEDGIVTSGLYSLDSEQVINDLLWEDMNFTTTVNIPKDEWEQTVQIRQLLAYVRAKLENK